MFYLLREDKEVKTQDIRQRLDELKGIKSTNLGYFHQIIT